MNKNLKLFLGVFLVLFGICLFALLPLFHYGFFTIHDDEQIARLYEMFKILSQGQIPPRWVPDLGFGFGFPLFNFYPPLVYYLGSLFHLVGFGYIDATKLVIGFGFFLSAYFMYTWVKHHFGYLAGFFAAFLYTYAPYHSVDVYVRGALSEFFGFVVIPAVLWSTDLLFEKDEKKFILLNGLMFGLLILTHTLVALQFAPIYGIYLVVKLLIQRKQLKVVLPRLAISLLIGVGLTAYFWLPSIAEKQYTLVDAILTKELASYAIHFVCPIQLWASPWGYGGSVGGCVDGLSLQAGKVQLVIGFLGVFLSLFVLLRKKQWMPMLGSFIFLFSLFMSLPYSKFFWDHISAFWYIQFPWRYLLFAAVGSAFLGGYVVSFVQKKWGLFIAIVLVVILSGLNLYQVRNYFRPQQYLSVSDSYYTSLRDIQWRVSRMSYEYVPKEVATRLSPEHTTELAINPSDSPSRSYVVVSGNAAVQELSNLSQLKKYNVTVYNTKTDKSAVLQINTYNFPGWKVYVNGKQVDQRIKNTLDLIQIELPAGPNSVEVVFTNTPVRTVSNGISLITVILTLLFVLKYRKLHI